MGLVTEGVVNLAMETGRAAAEKESNTRTARESAISMEKAITREKSVVKRLEIILQELEQIKDEKNFEKYKERLLNRKKELEGRLLKSERQMERTMVQLREWMSSQLAFKALFFKYGVVPVKEKKAFFWEKEKLVKIADMSESERRKWVASVRSEEISQAREEAKPIVRNMYLGRDK